MVLVPASACISSGEGRITSSAAYKGRFETIASTTRFLGVSDLATVQVFARIDERMKTCLAAGWDRHDKVHKVPLQRRHEC
jgi:hypothetical protein